MNTHLPTPPGISPLAFETISAPGSATSTLNQFSFQSNTPNTGINTNMFSTQPMFPDLTPPETNNMDLNTFPLFQHDPSPGIQSAQDGLNSLENQWAWDLVSLGMQEELPPDEITSKLYFPSFNEAYPFLEQIYTLKSVTQ